MKIKILGWHRNDPQYHFTYSIVCNVFTTLLLGRCRSGAPFRDVFSISVALSLGAVLRLSNITPGRSEARVVGRNTRQKRDNKKALRTILSAVLSHLRNFYQEKFGNLKKNEKSEKRRFYGQGETRGV